MAAPKQSSGVLTPCLHCRLASVLGAAHVLEPPTGTEQSQGQAAWEAGDTGAAHGYGAAQGAAHDDGAALCQPVLWIRGVCAAD